MTTTNSTMEFNYDKHKEEVIIKLKELLSGLIEKASKSNIAESKEDALDKAREEGFKKGYIAGLSTIKQFIQDTKI